MVWLLRWLLLFRLLLLLLLLLLLELPLWLAAVLGLAAHLVLLRHIVGGCDDLSRASIGHESDALVAVHAIVIGVLEPSEDALLGVSR